MKEPFPIETGRIVVSRAGRDKGTAYVVLGMPSADRAIVADGKRRTADHPKTKNCRHLAARPELVPGIREKVESKKRIFDQELRNSLDAAGYSDT